MTVKREGIERFSLARWSQRKLEAAEAETQTPAVAPTAPTAEAAGVTAASPGVGALPAGTAPAAPVELPSIESLTFDSDFTVFLRPDVDPGLRRAALKQLFRDPRFNVMDGLDTYIDDYSKADPIPPDMLAELIKRFDLASTPPQAAASDGEPTRATATASDQEQPRQPAPAAAAVPSPAPRPPATESAPTPGAAHPVPTRSSDENADAGAVAAQGTASIRTAARDERR